MSFPLKRACAMRTTKILDVTVGSRKIYRGWEQKLKEDFIGIDIRQGVFSRESPKLWAKQTVIVTPTVLADMKELPFQDDVFSSIIFDPPHTDATLNTWLGMYYGGWDQHETIQTLRRVNIEFARVLKVDGCLILKVMPRQFPLYEILLKLRILSSNIHVSFSWIL